MIPVTIPSPSNIPHSLLLSPAQLPHPVRRPLSDVPPLQVVTTLVTMILRALPEILHLVATLAVPEDTTLAAILPTAILILQVILPTRRPTGSHGA
tara:strand:+ start:233 stop:520 length:288 start_codon:yes stop_codon:yes gene_type:complete